MVAVTVKKSSHHKRDLPKFSEFCFYLECKGQEGDSKTCWEGLMRGSVAKGTNTGTPTQFPMDEKILQYHSQQGCQSACPPKSMSDNTALAFKPANHCFWITFNGESH